MEIQHIDIENTESITNLFENNKVYAYGSGSYFNKINKRISSIGLKFDDILTTQDKKIITQSKENYENIVSDSHIIICSSFAEQIAGTILSQRKWPSSIVFISNTATLQHCNTMILPVVPRMSLSERDLFRKYLSNANTYFEYGSGGSSVWANAYGLEIYGAESDGRWVTALHNDIGPNYKVNAINIGPTGAWGIPLSNLKKDKFINYPNEIFNHEIKFDFILIDGRFRVASCLAAILHSKKHSYKPTIFFDDFNSRDHYHIVLKYLDTIEIADNAAILTTKKDIDYNSVKKTMLKYKCIYL